MSLSVSSLSRVITRTIGSQSSLMMLLAVVMCICLCDMSYGTPSDGEQSPGNSMPAPMNHPDAPTTSSAAGDHHEDSASAVNKRAAPGMYNFGIGKKSQMPEPYLESDNYIEAVPLEDDIEDEGLSGEEGEMDAMKRAGPDQRFAFGIGKRGPQQRFGFGIGKREPARFAFGLGKRPADTRFAFGIGKRRDPELNRFAFGLGKRIYSLDDYMKRRFSFGLGKRASSALPERFQYSNFGLGRRKRSATGELLY